MVLNRDAIDNGVQVYIENITENINNWRKGAPLKIITHGWLSSGNSNSVNMIKDAYLKKRDINIIILDWSDPASFKLYPLPAYLTRQVGTFAARLIDNLVKEQFVSTDKVHLIGHSLGAHVAGAAGSATTTGKVSRITGLDPAGPAFEYIKITDNILDKTDAKFIDIIHTAAGIAGYFHLMGHADFYPNGGTPIQPGCIETTSIKDLLSSFSCSHGRSYKYFADTILHPHTYKAHKCDSWASYEKGECVNSPTAYMGDETSSTTNGVYYLSTKSQPPFGMDGSS